MRCSEWSDSSTVVRLDVTSDDNHRELCRFTVRKLWDLSELIIPFFEEHPLFTAKAEDFKKSADVVRVMERGIHLRVEGMVRIAEVTQAMNHRQPSRYLESSEAIRRPSQDDIEMKIWS